MLIDSFDTARLHARRLITQDYLLLRQMHIDVNTMKTLGGVRTEEQTTENLLWNLQQWEEHKVGLWLFFEKENNHFVGSGGLRHINIEEIIEIDLAYALLSKFWQKGYGTEIGRACLEIGFEKLNFNSIIAGTKTTNIASQKVIKKLKFNFERTIFKFGHDQFLYRLTKDQYHYLSK